MTPDYLLNISTLLGIIPTRFVQLAVLSLVFVSGTTMSAQIVSPTSEGNPQQKEKKQGNSSEFKIYEDTFDIRKVHYVRYDFEEEADSNRIFIDSFTLNDQAYRFIHRSNPPYIHLGRPGSPHRSAQPGEILQQTFSDIGVHTFDLYLLPMDKLLLYRQQAPITRARVHQGFNSQNTDATLQDNTVITLDFSRHFHHGKQGVLRLKRILDRGVYKDNQSKIMAFQAGLKYTPDSSMWQGALLYTFNEVTRKENGGIQNDSLIFDNDLYIKRYSIPTVLSDAQLRLTRYRITSLNRYFIASNKKLFVHDNLSYQKDIFKYYDLNIRETSDSLFYGAYLVDNRGINFSLAGQKIANDLYAGYRSAGNIQSIHAGIRYQYDQWKNDTAQKSFHLVIPHASIRAKWGTLFSSKHNVQFSLFHRRGFKWDNTLYFHSEKWGQLKLETGGSSLPPTLQQSWVYLSRIKVRDTTFSNVESFRFGGIYYAPGVNLSLGFYSNVYNRYLYWDQDAIPRQMDRALTLYEYRLQHLLHTGILYFANAVYFNASKRLDILQIPQWYTTHTLFAQHKFYNAVTRLRYGATLRYVRGGALAPGYSPLFGQYHLPKEVPDYDYYYNLDLFFLLKVPQFTIYLRLDNATDVIQQRLWHYAERWPANDWELRLGIKWVLLN